MAAYSSSSESDINFDADHETFDHIYFGDSEDDIAEIDNVDVSQLVWHRIDTNQ